MAASACRYATLRSTWRFLSLRGVFLGYAQRPRGIFFSPSAGCYDPALPTVGVRWAARPSARISHTLGSIVAVLLLHWAESSLPLDFVLLGFVCSALPCVLLLCGGLDTRALRGGDVAPCRRGARCPRSPFRSRGPNSPRLPPRSARRAVLRYASRFFVGYARHPPSAACRPSVGNVRSRRTGFGARAKRAHSLAWIRSRPFASGYARHGRCLGCRAARPVGYHRREPFKLTRSHCDTRNNLTTFSSTMTTDTEHNTARINITTVPPAASRKRKKKKCRAAYGATDTKYQKEKIPIPLMRSTTARNFKGSGVGPPPTAGAVPLCPIGQILLWGLRPLYPLSI